MEKAEERELCGVQIIPANGSGTVPVLVLLYARRAIVEDRVITLLEEETVIEEDCAEDSWARVTFPVLMSLAHTPIDKLLRLGEATVQRRQQKKGGE